MNEPLLKSGDKIIVVLGKYKGRTGEFIKNCSSVFPEHCRIKLTLKGREREFKTPMIHKSEINVYHEQ